MNQPKGYTTIENIESYLLIDIEESFEAQVESWIAEIEQYIDQQTGRNFIADTEATVRKYDGDNTRVLLIDDCVEVDEVKIGDTVLTKEESGDGMMDEYYVYPANELPKTKIKLAGGHFPTYPMQGISVKAKWGFSVDVPKDIQSVATILVTGIINYSNNSEGEIKSMSIGRYTVTYKDEKQWQDLDRMTGVLQSYKKYNL